MNEYRVKVVRVKTVQQSAYITVRAHSEADARDEAFDDMSNVDAWEDDSDSIRFDDEEVDDIEETESDSLPERGNEDECDCDDCIRLLLENRFNWVKCPKCKQELVCEGHMNKIGSCDPCTPATDDIGECCTDHSDDEEDSDESEEEAEEGEAEPAEAKPKSDPAPKPGNGGSKPWWESKQREN